MRWWRAWVTAAAIAATCLAAAASSSAAGWVPLGTIAPPGTPLLQGSAVATDPQGNLWVVTTNAGPAGHILVYERPPGGTFEPVSDVARPNVTQAYLAVGADGTVAVYWSAGSPLQYEAMVRPPGGPFATPQPVSAQANNTPSGVVQPDGTFVIAYTTGAPSNSLFLATRTPGPAGTFTTNPVPGQGGNANVAAPLMALSPTGGAALVWTDAPGGAIRLAEAERPVGGPLGALTPITTRNLQLGEMSQEFIPGDVDIDAAGNVLVSFDTVVSTGMFTGTVTLQASVRPAGSATFAAPQTLQAKALGGFGFDLVGLQGALDGAGDATTLWIDRGAGADSLRTAGATAPGFAFPATPSPIATTPTGAFGDALVALAGGGNAALALAGTSALGFTRGHAAAFGPATTLTTVPTPNSPAIGADAQGNAYVSWVTIPATGARTLSVAAYDATPPSIGPLSGAGTVATSSPAAFTVTASDTLSPTTVTWDFGDGQTATGTTVGHSWSNGGTFTVTATATDGAGNTATAKATETVIGGTVPDTTRPSITGAKLSRSRFAVGTGPTATSARAKRKPKPRGTVISYTLSEPAAMTFTITHKTPGRRSGKTCRATSKRVAKKSRCTATVTDGRLLRAAKHGGANVVAFTGRIGHRALRRRAYGLALSARDAAGNVSATRTLRFTIY